MTKALIERAEHKFCMALVAAMVLERKFSAWSPNLKKR